MLNRKPITFSPYPGQEQTTNKSTYLCISRAWPRRAWLSGTSQDAFGQEINQTSNLLLSESNRSGKKIVCPVPILFPQFLLVFLTIRKIPPRIIVPEILSKYLIMRKKIGTQHSHSVLRFKPNYPRQTEPYIRIWNLQHCGVFYFQFNDEMSLYTLIDK